MKPLNLTFTAILFTASSLVSQPKESDYYPITDIPLPEGEVIEVSGIDILPDGSVAIASRRGDIFVGKNVLGKEPDPEWTLFARGLHEVMA